MSKLVTLVCVLAVPVLLTGCGKDEEKKSSDTNNATTQSNPAPMNSSGTQVAANNSGSPDYSAPGVDDANSGLDNSGSPPGYGPNGPNYSTPGVADPNGGLDASGSPPGYGPNGPNYGTPGVDNPGGGLDASGSPPGYGPNGPNYDPNGGNNGGGLDASGSPPGYGPNGPNYETPGVNNPGGGLDASGSPPGYGPNGPNYDPNGGNNGGGLDNSGSPPGYGPNGPNYGPPGQGDPNVGGEGSIPGYNPNGNGGGNGGIPNFPKGSAKDAVLQLVLKVSKGDFKDLDQYISSSAKGTASDLRSGSLSDADKSDLQKNLSQVRLRSEGKGRNGGKAIYLENNLGKIIRFDCEKDGSAYRVTAVSVKDAPRGRR